MKTLILLLAFFTCRNICQGQNTSPYWSLAGNSNATGTSKLGTTNNIPLQLFTNNLNRMQITPDGKVAIGTTNTFIGKLTVFNNGSTPSGAWFRSSPPIFMGFGENSSGNADLLLGMSSNNVMARPVFFGRRARGTLAAPLKVQTNDYLSSFLVSGYDGSSFQNPASLDFYVDGTPSSGHVPTRISLVTGTNVSDRKERLKILNNGDFDFNAGQVFLQQSNGFLGIGTATPGYRLHVVSEGTAVYGNSTGANYGVWGSSSFLGVYGSGSTYGVYGSGSTGVYGSGSSYGLYGSGGTYGVYGYGTYGVYGNSASNFGVYGKSGYVGIYGIGTSYGVNGQGGQYGIAGDGSYIGVYGSSTSSFGVAGHSVNGNGGNFYSDNENGLVAGTSRTDKNWAAIFNGNTYAYGSYLGSDRNLKKDIQTVVDAIKIIRELKPRLYEFRKDGNFEQMHLPSGKHYGLVAQELEEVLPGLVKELVFQPPATGAMPADSATSNSKREAVSPAPEKITSKAVNYIELIPIVIKGIQEQETIINQQGEEIARLKSDLEELKSIIKNLTQTGGGKLLYAKGFLGQNVPNPADGITTIQYVVPDGTTSAEIRITNAQGQFIKSYRVTGEGQLSIARSSLSAGVYNYSLYSNGQLIQTRQMTIAR